MIADNTYSVKEYCDLPELVFNTIWYPNSFSSFKLIACTTTKGENETITSLLIVPSNIFRLHAISNKLI